MTCGAGVQKERVVAHKISHSRTEWSGDIPHNESSISYLRDSAAYPQLASVRIEIFSWRFYSSLTPLKLAQTLTESLNASAHTLTLHEGATRLAEDVGIRKVWRFDD